MKRRVAAWLLAAALASPVPRAASGGDAPTAAEHIGAALFRGEGLRATLPTMGGLEVEGAAAACGRCHGEAARGGLEGGVAAPPLLWRLLQAPNPARPGYDAALLRRALVEGLDSGGRQLHPLMPRYALGDAEVAALVGFLSDETAARARGGVTGDEMRIVVPHLPGEEFAPALIDALWTEPGRRAWGRRLRAAALPIGLGDVAAALEAELRAAPALAATAGPGVRVPGLDAALAARGLPHLFPLDTYETAPAGVLLAEAPLSVQVAILRRRAEALGGEIALVCASAAPAVAGMPCQDRVAAGATAVVFMRRLRQEDSDAIPARAMVFAPLDHAGPLLRHEGGLPFSLVLADPRGRGMPAPALEELRRLAPDLLARRPEVARRLHAAATLTVQAAQGAGPWPSPARLRSAAESIGAGEPGALLAPMRDGVRHDGAYGAQLLRLDAGGTNVRTEAAWERP